MSRFVCVRNVYCMRLFASYIPSFHHSSDFVLRACLGPNLAVWKLNTLGNSVPAMRYKLSVMPGRSEWRRDQYVSSCQYVDGTFPLSDSVVTCGSGWVGGGRRGHYWRTPPCQWGGGICHSPRICQCPNRPFSALNE